MFVTLITPESVAVAEFDCQLAAGDIVDMGCETYYVESARWVVCGSHSTYLQVRQQVTLKVSPLGGAE